MQREKLFNRDFTLVLIGQVISLFGNAILRFALPLHLLRETGSAALFGTVSAAAVLPMILCSLGGGVLADRVNKRNIMVGLDSGTAVLILAFYLLQGQVPLVPLMVVCLMLLYGISGTYEPAVQASIPALVEADQLTSANAVINVVYTLSGLLGPVIGGVLFGTWGLAPILLLSIACFAFSAAMEVFIHIPYEKLPAADSLAAMVKSDVRDSYLYIKEEKPVFLSVIFVLAMFGMVLSSAMIVGIPVIVVNILGMSDAQMGMTEGAMGLGGLVGGVLAGVLGERLKLRHGYVILLLCSGSAACMGLSLLPVFPAFISYLLITFLSFFTMVVSTQFSVLLLAEVQRQTPMQLIGKITAFLMAMANCALPLGQAVYGALFGSCAETPWLILFGSAAVSLGVSLYSKKVFAELEQCM